ncbi:MAG: YraN family protein [Patescibacteria group bacterium]
MTTALPQVRGKKGEEIAVRYLQSRGYDIVKRNARYKGGEIDIVAREKDELVFVEVKSRSTRTFGWPEEGVTQRKRRRMKLSAGLFLSSHREYQGLAYRFDIMALELDEEASKARVVHYKNIEMN